jgi:hypothetical protein
MKNMEKNNNDYTNSEDSLSYYRNDLEKTFSQFHEESIKTSKHKGEEDGNRGLPVIDDNDLTPFEKNVINQYQANVEKLFENGRQHLEDLHDKKFRPLKDEIDEHQANPDLIDKKIVDAEHERDRKLNELDSNHRDRVKEIHNELDWENTKKDFDTAEERFEAIADKHDRREIHIQFKPFWAYIVLILGIGICEFPLNNQVFLTFRETPLLTLIMSGVLVISLPFLAHGSGKFLKQGKERPTYYWLLGIALVLILAISYFTSILRTAYLAEKGIPLKTLETDMWVFFTIGLVLYFVGFIASYFAHDESVEFVEVYRMYHREKRNYKNKRTAINEKVRIEKEQYNIYKEEIQNEFSKSKKEYKKHIKTLKNKLTDVIGNYDQVLHYFVGFENRINQCCKAAVNIYRDKNLTYRENHARPKYWKDKIPNLAFRFDNLSELSENPKKPG